MRKIILLLVIAAALAGASYAAARFTAGKVTGSASRVMGSPQTAFAFSGVKNLAGAPRAWVVSYPRAQGFPSSPPQIYVSPTGTLLGTRPADLAQRLSAMREDE